MKVEFCRHNFKTLKKETPTKSYINQTIKSDTVNFSSNKKNLISDKPLTLKDYISTAGFILKLGLLVLGTIVTFKIGIKHAQKMDKLI